MPNNNYALGRRFEYAFINKLKALPTTICAVRTAGSHGPFDVMWVSASGVQVFQLKSGSFPNIKEIEIAMLQMIDKVVSVRIAWRPRGQSVKIMTIDQYLELKEKPSLRRWPIRQGYTLQQLSFREIESFENSVPPESRLPKSVVRRIQRGLASLPACDPD